MSEQMNIPSFSDADKRETAFHNFDEQPEVVGKLKAINPGSYGQQYLIDTPNGEITVGTYDVLHSKIHETDVDKWIKIKFIGNAVSPKTKRTYKDFDVFIR